MKKWLVCILAGFFLFSAGTVSAIVSDDFSSASLNTSLWTFINPASDSTLTMTGTNVQIIVPSGISHDVWTNGNFAPRIMQSTANTDFEIEAKFQSELKGQYQMQGIIVEQDSGNFLRFDFYSTTSEIKIYSASFHSGVATVRLNSVITGAPGPVPLYMRVKREGSQWTQDYSYDGVNWLTAVTFDDTMTVTSAGAFFGNAGSNPAFTGSLDYFFNTASPVSPQDGGDSVPPVISVWYGLNQKFGQIGVPQKMAGILGTVTDPAGLASFTYSLNGGLENALSIGPDGTRLQANGDFNAEIDSAAFTCGNNTVVLTATDKLGNSAAETVDVEYACGNIWPESYSINWSTVTNVQDVAQAVDGIWTVEGNSVRPTVQGYNRMLAFGDIDPSWDVYEVTVPVTINSLDPSVPYGPFVGFLLRWQGHQAWDEAQPKHGWYPIGALMGYDYVSGPEGNDYKLRIIGNKGVSIGEDNSGRHLTVGVPYIFKMRAETFGGVSVYSLKVWEQGTTEPAGWDIQGQGLQGELKNGSAAFFTHYVDASFGNVTVTPGSFSDDVKAPVMSNIQLLPDAFSAVVSWITDEPSTSRVTYGESAAYEGGTAQSGGRPTVHSVVLTGLKPGTAYHYKIISADGNGNAARSADLSFTTTAVQSTIVSDDFNRCSLGSAVWTFVDPLGDSQLNMTGTNAEIAVPSGVSHDAWINNNAPRIMQLANNRDFELEVKFESAMSAEYQMQGVIVQQGSGNYLRFDTHSDGKNTRLYAAVIVAGVGNVKYDTIIGSVPSAEHFYMRVKRQGNLWTQAYSADGVSWMSGAVFNYKMTVKSVGAFAGNDGAAPAHTARIDYFFNTAAPVVPEDSGTGVLALTVLGNGTVQKNPEKSAYLCGDVVEFTPVPAIGWSFSGWSGDITGSNNPETLTISGGNKVEAKFEIKTYALSVTSDGAGTGNVTGAGTYNHGDLVALSAHPDESSTFSSWSGDCSGSNAETNIIMNSTKTCIANFVLKSFTIGSTANNGNIICTPNPVDYGMDVNCDVSPNAGYAIKDVKVDDVSLGATETYSFHTVTDDHEIEAGFIKTIEMLAVGDVNNNGSEDLAIFHLDMATGANNIYVKDGLTGALISKVTFEATAEILELKTIEDVSGNGVKELVALCRRNSSGAAMVSIRDALTGAIVKTLSYDKTFEPIGMVVMPDINDNGKTEIGALLVSRITGIAKFAIKDTSSGLLLKTLFCGNLYDVINAVVVDDLNGNSKPEVGVQSINKTTGAVLMRIYDTLSGAFVKQIPYSKISEPLGVEMLADINGNGYGEGAVLGPNLVNGGLLVQVKDMKTGGVVSNILFGKSFTPVGSLQIDDVSGNEKPEIGILGSDATKVTVVLRDSMTGAFVRKLVYPKAYEAVRAVALPDLNGNGTPEIAVAGENLATGAVQVTIRDASTGLWVGRITVP